MADECRESVLRFTRWTVSLYTGGRRFGYHRQRLGLSRWVGMGCITFEHSFECWWSLLNWEANLVILSSGVWRWLYA